MLIRTVHSKIKWHHIFLLPELLFNQLEGIISYLLFYSSEKGLRLDLQTLTEGCYKCNKHKHLLYDKIYFLYLQCYWNFCKSKIVPMLHFFLHYLKEFI